MSVHLSDGAVRTLAEGQLAAQNSVCDRVTCAMDGLPLRVSEGVYVEYGDDGSESRHVYCEDCSYPAIISHAGGNITGQWLLRFYFADTEPEVNDE